MMKNSVIYSRVLSVAAAIFSVIVIAHSAHAEDAADAHEVYEPMAVFAGLAGKTWRGEGTGPDGNPIVDIAKHEYILGGRAFQSTHRLESGVYGGKTIMFFDEGGEQYIFHYFTTAGFHTTGVIEPTENGFRAVEKVQNHEVFDEVRSELFVEEGRLRVVSSHVDKQGNATEGEELIYVEIDDPGELY